MASTHTLGTETVSARWRGMVSGLVASLLSLLLFRFVEESPVWTAARNDPQAAPPSSRPTTGTPCCG